MAQRRVRQRASNPPILAVLLLLILAVDAPAARIGELIENDPWQQARRFFMFSDPGLRLGLIGALLFGATCGLLGSFIVVRKMALIGDAISHAVLPGVALGFLWSMDKDPLAILVGATVAGLTGSLVVDLIKRTTKIKQDAALGIDLVNGDLQRVEDGHVVEAHAARKGDRSADDQRLAGWGLGRLLCRSGLLSGSGLFGRSGLRRGGRLSAATVVVIAAAGSEDRADRE